MTRIGPTSDGCLPVEDSLYVQDESAAEKVQAANGEDGVVQSRSWRPEEVCERLQPLKPWTKRHNSLMLDVVRRLGSSLRVISDHDRDWLHTVVTRVPPSVIFGACTIEVCRPNSPASNIESLATSRWTRFWNEIGKYAAEQNHFSGRLERFDER